MGQILDLTGQTFGRLIVLGLDETRPYHWVVQCACPKHTVKSVRRYDLLNSKTTSCGCHRRDTALQNIQRADNTKPIGFAASKNLFWVYKDSAKRRKYVFDLTFEQFVKLTQQDCYYCNAKPARSHFSRNGNKNRSTAYICNGIDRFYNDEGYTIKNSVACCTICNDAKGTMNGPDFINLCKRVANVWSKENEQR